MLQEYPDMSAFDLKETIIDACRKLDVPPYRQGRGLVQVIDASAER